MEQFEKPRFVRPEDDYKKLLQYPQLQWACTTSRNIMYDLMVNYRTKDLVLRDEHVYLFTRSNKMQWTNYSRPQLFGYLCLNFRYRGLERKVKEEAGRLKEMRAELKEERLVRLVDPSRRSEGYVKLSVNRTCKQHLYPRRPDDQVAIVPIWIGGVRL